MHALDSISELQGVVLMAIDFWWLVQMQLALVRPVQW